MTGCRLRRCRWTRLREVLALAGALSLATLATLAGCGGSRPPTPRSDFIPFSPEQKIENDAQVTRAYRIQEGDLLSVRFAYEKNLNQDGVVVLNDGAISLTGVDRVRVAGLTLAETDSVLTFAYSHEYREPALSVMVVETVGRRVYVMGQVKNPGFYRVPLGGMDVMSAIGMADGFSDDAAPSATLVVRVTQQGYQVQEVDLDSFGSGSYAALSTIPLQSYDIIYVPRSRVGDIAYFAENVLASIASVTRIFYDLTYITTNTFPGGN
jgi:protein involved in polysaccharide export with SLBB domain